MKKITYVVVCIMIFLCTLSPSTANAQLDEFSEENAYKHVVYLSKDIGIREAGTENALRASEYIKTNFGMYGLETQTQEFEFDYMYGLDKVTTGVPTPVSPPPEMKREGRNVIGILRGTSDEEIIICAHYDSREGPGANDDASGVGVLLELARVFSNSKNKTYNKTLVFVAFDAEEQLAQGSKHFLSNLDDREIGNIIGVLDLDCVGRGDLLVAYCWEPYPISSPYFRYEFYHTPGEFVEIVYNEMGDPPSMIIEQLQAYLFNFRVYAFSDYTTFMSDDFYDEKGIIVPAIEFTFLETGMQRKSVLTEKNPPIPDLHCMEDTYEKIEVKNLKGVGEIVLNAVQKLDGHERFKNKPETGLIFEVNGKALNVSYLLILLILFILPVLTSALAYMKNKRVVALFLVASPFLLLNLIESQTPYSPVKIDIPILVMLFSFLFLFGYLHQNQNKRIGKTFIAGFISLLLIGTIPFWDYFALNLIGYQVGLLLLSFIIVITVSILRSKS